MAPDTNGMKNFELKKFGDDAALAQAAAKDWLDMVQQSPAHLVALSGGRIAKTLCAAITERVGRTHASLKNVDFFWADERCVPPTDLESNYLLAKENLFDKAAVTPNKIHRLRGEIPPAEAVEEAIATINRIAPRNSAGVPVVDLIFLGLGEDGHIASLMPNVPESTANAQAPYVCIKDSPKPPPNRLSMSYAVIAAAKNVWMLAAGAAKEQALRDSLPPKPATPFGRVLQSRAHTVIYTNINYSP